MLIDKISINDTAIIKVNTARATIEKVAEFKQVITEVLEEKYIKIIVDLSACEFIDSTFFGALIFAQKKLKPLGEELRLVTEKDSLSAIFVITNMGKIFKQFKSVEEAMESFLE